GVGASILTHRIPAMEAATLARGYRAFDCYSTDRHAILGPVDGVDGLYLATAFSGSGFKIAPAVGQCMAELITEGRAKTVDLTAFGLRRFAEGPSPQGPYPYAPRLCRPAPRPARDPGPPARERAEDAGLAGAGGSPPGPQRAADRTRPEVRAVRDAHRGHAHHLRLVAALPVRPLVRRH